MLKSILNSLLFAFLFGLIGPAGSSGSEEFISDARIKADFETKLSALFQAGGVPTATDTLRQLHDKKKPSVTPPVAAPDGNLSPGHHRALSATLVLGHLYLCDTCEKKHGNVAGGVIISPDGLALTNYHVLDFKEAIVFGAMTEEGVVYAIDEVIAASKEDDIALIRLKDASELPFVTLQETLKTGDDVFVISHPDGYFYTLTKGYLSRKYMDPKQQIPKLQITAAFARGSSGSGIFNDRNELVGIAASTNSIYYEPSEENPGNFQMVINSGVPVSSIMKLFASKAPRD